MQQSICTRSPASALLKAAPSTMTRKLGTPVIPIHPGPGPAWRIRDAARKAERLAEQTSPDPPDEALNRD